MQCFIKIKNTLLNIDEIICIEEVKTSNPNVQIEYKNGNFITTDESKDMPDVLVNCVVWFKTTNGSAPFSKEFNGIKLDDFENLLRNCKNLI